MVYDAIIVGTGPAGSTTASLLAENGFRVLALEKEVHPRIKPCGGCISKKIDHSFDLISLGVVERVISGVIFSYRGREECHYTSRVPAAYMVNRPVFDAVLSRKARKSGADIREGCRVKEVKGGEGGIAVDTTCGRFEGRIAIGADGSNGITRRIVQPGKIGRKYATIEQKGFDVRFLNRFHNEVAIDIGNVGVGYGWIFPHNDFLSLGIAGTRENGVPLKRKFREFTRQVGFDADHEPVHAHPIHCFVGHEQKLFSKGIVLVGEAAGLVDPFLGEGIYHAMRSAQLAGHYVTKYLKGESEGLHAYECHVAHEFYLEFRRALQLSHFAFAFPHFFYRNLTARPEGIELLFSVLRGEHTYNHFFWMALQWLGLKCIPRIIRPH